MLVFSPSGSPLRILREDAEVRSYSAPNHYEGPVVAWKLPEGWGENPGMGGMMAGSFHIKTEEGHGEELG